jgi:hypothetical protein
MTKPTTQAERMQRIETLVEQGFANIAQTQAGFADNWKDVKLELSAIRMQMASDKQELKKVVDDDVADLARLKNRGAGIIAGITLAVGVTGVAFADAIKTAWQALTG